MSDRPASSERTARLAMAVAIAVVLGISLFVAHPAWLGWLIFIGGDALILVGARLAFGWSWRKVFGLRERN
jgi:hypothetical protein